MNRLVLVPLSRGQGNCTDTTFIPSEMRVVVHHFLFFSIFTLTIYKEKGIKNKSKKNQQNNCNIFHVFVFNAINNICIRCTKNQ